MIESSETPVSNEQAADAVRQYISVFPPEPSIHIGFIHGILCNYSQCYCRIGNGVRFQANYVQ